MSLDTLFPNGQLLAVLSYIDDPILGKIPWNGEVNVGPITVGSVDQGAAGVDPWLVDVTNAKTITGTFDALNDTLVFPCAGCGDVTFKLIGGTLSGSILFQGSNDGGITYDNLIFAIDGSDFGYPASVTYNSSSTSAAVLQGAFIHMNAAGFTHIKATCIIYNSGSSNGTFYGNQASSNFRLPSAKISADWVRITDELGTSSLDITGGAALVRAVDLDIRNLVFATDKVDVSGSSIATTPPAQVTAGPTLLNAVGMSITLALANNVGADFTLVFAAYTGQIRPFVSFDGGATFDISLFADAKNGTFYPPNTITYAAETSTQNLTIFIPAGATHVKMDLPAYTSGSVTASIRANNIQFIPNYGKGFAGDIRNIQWGQQIGGAPNPGGTWINAIVTDSGPSAFAAGLAVRDISSQAAITEGPFLSSDGLGVGIATYEKTSGLIAVINTRTDAPGGADVGVITRNIPSGIQPVSGAVTPAIATASNPTYTEAAASALSQDLSGNLRTRISAVVDNEESFIPGTVKSASLDTSGRIKVLVAPEEYVNFFDNMSMDLFGEVNEMGFPKNPFERANFPLGN